jgi:hypothetical protein
LNYECSARMFRENKGRFPRDSLKALKAYDSDATCERVDPAKKRMLKEKFRIAESFAARFIGNIVKLITNERQVQGVRWLDGMTLTLSVALDVRIARSH